LSRGLCYFAAMRKSKDRILRKNLAKPSIRVISKVLGQEVVKVEAVPPVLIQTILERNPDTLSLASRPCGDQFIVHWEYQATNDATMLLRNAVYDYLIYAQYGLPVMTIVLYTGNAALNMKDGISFFGNIYSCLIIDIRDLDPEIFLQSTDYKEVILAVLAGRNKRAEKLQIVRKIISKLREMLRHSDTPFAEMMTELELLAKVRGKPIHEQVKKEITTMFMFERLGLDIRDSWLYQQGNREGKKEGKKDEKMKTALNFLKAGVDLAIVQQCTGIGKRTLLKMQNGTYSLS